jgi:hypothetical protein
MKMGLFFLRSSLAVFVIMLLAAVTVTAVNSPESVTVNASSHRSLSSAGVAVPAQAGNVSQLIINDTRVTSHWQGYYGLISGTITLDDAAANTIFDWRLASPLGEVYFANASSVTWSNITCINLNISKTVGGMSKLDTTILEGAFNISSSDADGINDTFNWTYASSFSVGAITIDSTYNCPMVYTYVNNLSQQSRFKEVALTDNVSAVFTTLLERDQVGFDGGSYDFQSIVPVNSAGISTYYVYVELS